MRHVVVACFLAITVTACGGESASEAPGTTSQVTATTGGSQEATSTTVATTMATTTTEPTSLELPDDLALQPIGDSGVSGTAHFAMEGTDQAAVTVSLTDESIEALFFDAFAFLVLEGGCAEQTEPADFAGALGTQTVDVGEETMRSIEVPLTDLIGEERSVLVTDAPGQANLACGELTP